MHQNIEILQADLAELSSFQLEDMLQEAIKKLSGMVYTSELLNMTFFIQMILIEITRRR